MYSRFKQFGRPSGRGLGTRLKKNWREIRDKIIREEQKIYKAEIVRKIQRVITTRSFEQETKSHDRSPLPKHTFETMIWRHSHGYDIFPKLVNTGNLKKSLNVRLSPSEKSIVIEANAMSYKTGRSGKSVRYSPFLEEAGWTHTKIPDIWEIGGQQRKQWYNSYVNKVNNRFRKELYDQRFNRS